jgi:uncharacterized protein (TIGR02996 family)
MGKREELEAKMIENPGDADLRMVYADLLQSTGDPRGELIVLQHRGKQDEVDAYLAQHEEALLGPLARFKKTFDHQATAAFEWHLGFIKKATVGYDSYVAGDLDEDADECTADRVVAALLQHPSALLLEELAVTFNLLDDGVYFEDVCKALTQYGAAALRSLSIGEFSHAGGPGGIENGNETESSWTALGDASEMWAKLPRLERLRLQMNLGGYQGPSTIGTFDLPKLQRLEVVTGGLAADNARSFVSSKLPELVSMVLWFGDDNYGGTTTVKDLEPLFAGANVPKLVRLGLVNCSFTDEIVDALAPSKLLGQLEELSLEHGSLDDAGVQKIVAHADAFRHLKSLDLNNNNLTSNGIAAARAVCPIVSSEQRGADDRYVPLSE